MKRRLPTLDEIESGHDINSAALAGDVDAGDALDAEATRIAHCLDTHSCSNCWCAR